MAPPPPCGRGGPPRRTAPPDRPRNSGCCARSRCGRRPRSPAPAGAPRRPRGLGPAPDLDQAGPRERIVQQGLDAAVQRRTYPVGAGRLVPVRRRGHGAVIRSEDHQHGVVAVSLPRRLVPHSTRPHPPWTSRWHRPDGSCGPRPPPAAAVIRLSPRPRRAGGGPRRRWSGRSRGTIRRPSGTPRASPGTPPRPPPSGAPGRSRAARPVRLR